VKSRIGLQVSNVDLALPEPYSVGFAMSGILGGRLDRVAVAGRNPRYDRTEQERENQCDRFLFRTRCPLKAFTPDHLVRQLDEIEVGTLILIVGFPLGFQDTLHHLPVARQAIIATSFGLRFQGKGYFLTDARMHRGASGAPVVARAASRQSGRKDLSWRLLGVHTSRMDVDNRDVTEDERLNLNCAWYADIIMKLTEAPPGG
jgi:hypothetical protein